MIFLMQHNNVSLTLGWNREYVFITNPNVCVWWIILSRIGSSYYQIPAISKLMSAGLCKLYVFSHHFFFSGLIYKPHYTAFLRQYWVRKLKNEQKCPLLAQMLMLWPDKSFGIQILVQSNKNAETWWSPWHPFFLEKVQTS